MVTTKAIGATRSATGRRQRWALLLGVATVIISFVLTLQLLLEGRQIFSIPRTIITTTSSSTTITKIKAIIGSGGKEEESPPRSSSILKLIDDLIGKRVIITDADLVDNNLSEIRPEDGVRIFPGAREWYEYWTHASRRGDGGGTGQREVLVDKHIHDDYVAQTVESVSEGTLQHIQDMKSRYANGAALPDFHVRGIGWVMDRLDMVLTVVVAGNFASVEEDNVMLGDDQPLPTIHSGPTTIFIVDTVGKRKCGGGSGDNNDDSWIDVQPPLTMWVRANGKSPTNGEGEIFSGTAIPHSLHSSSSPNYDSRCTWRYDFEPKYPGIYTIHVKVVMFNGFYDSHNRPCIMKEIPTRGDQFDTQSVNASIPGDLEALSTLNYEFAKEIAEEGNYTHHRGLVGFKMYDPAESCCDACKQARNCKMFSAPGAANFDHCELYFDRIQDDLDFIDRESGRFLGRERNYSYLRQDPSEFPNIRRRRRRHGRHLVVSDLGLGGWPGRPPFQGFPPPVAAGAVSYFIGCGWSSTMSLESPCHFPSDDLVFGSGQKIEVVGHQQEVATEDLRACNLDDEKLDVSNGRWVRHAYPDESVCLPETEDNSIAGFQMHLFEYHGDLPPYCWHRDDLTKVATVCLEGGCGYVFGHKWKTELKNESKWFGMWEAQECRYFDMGDSDIQRCVDVRNISSISAKGASISSMLSGVLTQKLKNINMTTGGKSVFLDTLAMPHLLWHDGIRVYQEKLEAQFPSLLDNDGVEHYFVTSFYYTSEREPHIQVDRSLQYSKMAYDILTPKGYRMINAFDVTSAFAYDTDGQGDGLHIGGPPLKAILTKFFHHLCRGV